MCHVEAHQINCLLDCRSGTELNYTVLKCKTFFLIIVLLEALSCSSPFIDVERRYALSAM